MKKTSFVLVLVVVMGLLSVGSASCGEVTLKAVCFIPKNHPLVSQTLVWVDAINKELKGKLKINYVGGPEVIPGMQQVEALGKGVIDITFNPTAYYQNILPEGSALTLSKLTPTEERKPGGFYDLMVKQHKRINARYLGRWLWSPFYLWSKKEVKSLDDLKGVKMRTSALYDRFMKAIGIVPVTIKSSETYTALERGTVDGFGWPLLGPRARGWTKVVNNIFDHPFYNQNCTILMNLDKWNKLPPDVRKAVEKITAQFEPKMMAHFQAAIKGEWKKLDEAGIHRVKFSGSDAEKYLNTAYAVEWEHLAKKVPDLVAELKKTTGN